MCELRASSSDRSQRKGDLLVDNMHTDGRQTLLDVGIAHPLIDTRITNKSTVERGFATNAYGSRKNKDYNAIIKAKNLDLHYESVTFGTFGSFGTGTWRIITKACDPSTHPKGLGEFNPWNAPGPKRDFILSLGFALQRANSRCPACCAMLTVAVALLVAVVYIPLAPALLRRMTITSGDLGVCGFNFTFV